MSVRTAFTVIGTVVGAYFGNPQLGYAIGSLVGNAVDPVKVYGPELGDGSVQTSRPGVAINLVFGRITVFGSLIEAGPVDKFEVEHQEGKGGPVTVEQRARQTFAILMCKNGMGGGIAGIGRVKFDGKLVYDPGPPPEDPDELAEWQEAQTKSGKFLRKCRIHLGTSTQMPDPALEAIHGIGTTPAYRNRAYLVFDQWDITDYGMRIPQIEVEVIGTGSPGTGTLLEPLQYGGSPKPWREDNLGTRDPRKAGVTYEYGYYDGAGTSWFDTLDEAITYAQGSFVDPAFERHVTGTPQIMGWTVNAFSNFVPGCPLDAALSPWDLGNDANGYQLIQLCLSRYPFGPETERISIDAGGAGPAPPDEDAWSRGVYHGGTGFTRFKSGVIVPYTPDATPPWYGAPPYNDGDYLFVVGGVPYGQYAWLGDFDIQCRAIPDCGLSTDELLPVPEVGDVWYDLARRALRFDTVDSTCAVVAGSFKQLQALDVTPGQYEVINTLALGPVLESGSSFDGEAFWEARYNKARARGLMAPGLVYGVDYPVSMASACECMPLVPYVDPSTLILADVQARLCEMVDLEFDRIDVSDLLDLVRGFKVAKLMTAAQASRALQDAYIYARGEWDSQLRFVKLGGPVLFTITEDDLLAEDGLQELTRGDGYSVPRKIHVVAYDATDYSPLPQTAERFSPDIISQSEETFSLPVVLTPDEVMQCADRMMKIRQASQEGGFRLRTWSKFLSACATDVFAYNGKRFRIDAINAADGVVEIEESRADRQSAYTSNLTGIPAPDGRTPDSHLSGPTLFAVMNLPSIRQEDNVSGVYVAACGVLASWDGCAVMLSIDSGATYRVVAAITEPTPIGYLTQNVSDGGESPSPTLTVNLFGGEIDSVTDEQMALRFNLAAINDPDGVSELVQFQEATELDEGLYLLDDVVRGVLETEAVEHFVGDQFVHLRKAVFVPIDSALAGQTLYFRAVSNGTEEDANPVVTLVFDPPTFILDGGVVE